MKNIDIGPGSMTYTVIYQKPNGDFGSEVVLGSYSKPTAWRQSQKRFKKRVVALIPGNHKVLLGS
jgi:hypothetical protein